MQATGTDGQHIRERFADYLPNGEDGNSRDDSDTDGMTSLDHQSSMIVSSSKNEDLDGVVQGDSGSVGERRRPDSNRGWRFCRPISWLVSGYDLPYEERSCVDHDSDVTQLVTQLFLQGVPTKHGNHWSCVDLAVTHIRRVTPATNERAC